MTVHLAALLAASGLALAAPASQAADRSPCCSTGILGGLHTPFYLGLERGYYSDEGIDLTINEGRGSGARCRSSPPRAIPSACPTPAA